MRNIIASLGVAGTVQLLNIVSGVLAARFLLPEGRGELAAIMLWPGIVGGLVSLSLDKGVMYYAAARRKDARFFALTAVATSGLIAVFAMTASYLLVPVFMKDYGSDAIALGRVVLFITPANYVFSIALSAMLATQHYLRWNILRTGSHLLYVAILLTIITVINPSVQHFAYAFMAGNIVVAGVGLTFVLRLPRNELAQRSTADLKALLSYGVGMHIPALAEFAGRQIDKALVAVFLEPAKLGLYVVALSASALVATVAGAITPLAFSKVANTRTDAARERVFGRFFRLALLLSVSAAGFLAVTGHWLIVSLFGNAFVGAATLLPILIVYSLAISVSRLLFHALQAQAQLAPIRFANVAQVMTLTGAMLILLPKVGVQGAAVALALSAGVAAMIAAVGVWKKLGWNVLALCVPTQDDVRYVRTRFWQPA